MEQYTSLFRLKKDTFMKPGKFIQKTAGVVLTSALLASGAQAALVDTNL